MIFSQIQINFFVGGLSNVVKSNLVVYILVRGGRWLLCYSEREKAVSVTFEADIKEFILLEDETN